MAYEVEIILMRQTASYLAIPIFVVDPDGDLVYYNEPAEELLGQRYDEAGEMPLEEWSTAFLPMDENGGPLPPGDLPLVIALQERRPAFASFWITGYDQTRRHLSVVAFPLTGQNSRDLGAVAMFWQEGPP